MPLSHPIEEAKSASRGLTMVWTMLVSGLLAAAAAFACERGWLHWLLLFEAVMVLLLYVVMRLALVPQWLRASVQDPLRREPAHALQQMEIELPSQNRRDAKNADRLGGQGCDAAADQAAHLFRNAEQGVLDRLVQALG